MLHDQCKKVFRNVAELLRDIQQNEKLPADIRARAQLVGTQVIFAGYRIIDMEIAARDVYRGDL